MLLLLLQLHLKITEPAGWALNSNNKLTAAAAVAAVVAAAATAATAVTAVAAAAAS